MSLMPICSGSPEMHRRAVHRREARGDLHRADRVRRLHRPHRHDQRAVEHAGRHAVDVGAIHRHVACRRRCGAPRCRPRSAPPRRRTSSRCAKPTRSSRHSMADVGRLLDQFAVAPDAVARQVGAHIEILAQRRQTRIARPRTPPSTGQGRGLAWAKRRKSCASALRQDHQVRLHVAGRQARGRAGEQALPHPQPLGAAVACRSRRKSVHHAPPCPLALEPAAAELRRVDRPLVVIGRAAQRHLALHPPIGNRSVQPIQDIGALIARAEHQMDAVARPGGRSPAPRTAARSGCR